MNPIIEHHRKIENNEKLVILFSGGLDSVIAYTYANRLFPVGKVMGLFVNIGQPYAEFEEISVRKFKNSTRANIVTLNYPFIQEQAYYYERATPIKQIIPGRNMTLATLAANFGNTIWINALHGELKDYIHDKNWTFFKEASRVLSYTFDNRIIVESPFWHMTKTETVAMALNKLNMPKEVLTNTVSCYNPRIVDGKVYFCGSCLTCFKRKVAMINNGIEEDYFADPFKSWYALEVHKRITNNELDPEVVNDYAKAYSMVGLSLNDIPKIA